MYWRRIYPSDLANLAMYITEFHGRPYVTINNRVRFEIISLKTNRWHIGTATFGKPKRKTSNKCSGLEKQDIGRKIAGLRESNLPTKY